MSGPALSDRATVASFRLDVPGEPRGQGRPRFARVGSHVRAYTDIATTSAAARLQNEWIAAGRPQLAPGPYRLIVRAYLGRPKNHRGAGGRLTALGERTPYPTRRPDIDNVQKLGLDSLVAVGAVPDDAACVEVWAIKAWAEASIAGPRVEIVVESLGAGA